MFIGRFRTLDEAIGDSVSNRRFAMVLLSVFAVSGLILAVTGNFGVIAYSLSLRAREVGIRVALGARPRDVIALMSSQSLVPAAIGIVAGNLGAFLLTRLVAHLLYTVSATDPAIFLPSTLLLTLSCVAASALPALRSSRVSPALLLQAE